MKTKMKSGLGLTFVFLLIGMALGLGVTQEARAIPYYEGRVYVDIYQGGQVVYSSDYSDVLFGTNYGWAWNPVVGDFEAVMTGKIFVFDSGTYDFGLRSDDGSRFYIANQLVIDNWGAHGPTWVTLGSAFLEAGSTPFKVEFFEGFGGESGVDLYGVTSAPEPATMILLGSGLLGTGIFGRKRLRKGEA